MCLFASLLLHKQDKGFEDAKAVIESLKNKGVSATKVVVELAHINAGVLLHPSFVTVDDIKEVKAPLAVLGAEFDHLSPPALVKQFEEVLATKPEFDGFVKIFPGVAHGWTVRYKAEDEAEVKAAEEAHNDALEWFAKHVK
ncbi:unnamed protein product [Linum tenue]|uniref:Dienelactone hydrolase domain-containing protein n=1 Tax=Linum tenue TaxID=586396 RepID=A0AAV0P5W4_9ROSI|nr:unnamed protein product [Linum tenue]